MDKNNKAASKESRPECDSERRIFWIVASLSQSVMKDDCICDINKDLTQNKRKYENIFTQESATYKKACLS